MNRIETSIEQIGNRLVLCDQPCEGIVCNRKTGQIPRCMYFETENRSGGLGAAVVGLNPGPASEVERKFYDQKGCSYASVVSWMRGDGGAHFGIRHRYYHRLKDLLGGLDLHGPILWTELAKCESAEKGKLPPLSTFRNCMNSFLQGEIEAIPPDWPLFGVGREAFTALAYRFVNRIVIGVPHPTGSRGGFRNLFDTERNLRHEVQQVAKKAFESTGAVWLTH